MKRKPKKAREGCAGPSQDPRNPRKAQSGTSKPAKGKKAQTARARQVRESAQTDVDGAKAWTERVVDTVELLYRRKQIDADQRQAAHIYLDAFEACQGGIPCPLAERVRGGGIPSPTEAQMLAARRLAEALAVLGRLDDRLVAAVVCEGRSIEETAGRLLGVTASGRPIRADAEHVGKRLRLALTALAEAWGISGSGRRRGQPSLRGSAPAPAASSAASTVTPPATGKRQVERGRVVHATATRVYEV